MKKAILVLFILFNGIIYSQNKIKYSYSLSDVNFKQIEQITTQKFGVASEESEKERIWHFKNEKNEYKITLKNKKVKVSFTGDSEKIKEKLKEFYKKIKDIS